MSYTLVEDAQIQKNKVYFTSASSNVRPHRFHKVEVKFLSRMYQQSGLGAVLEWMATTVRSGECKFYGSSALCRLVNEGYDLLPKELQRFLDDERLGAFVRDFALAKLEAKEFPSAERIQALQKLRSKPETVVSICRTRPEAFDYAAIKLQKDRETAKAYVEQCADMLLFGYPEYFKEDKEIAEIALKQNGGNYRYLGRNLREDKSIILLAYDSTQEGKHHAFFANLIPQKIREDQEFMKRVLSRCPSLRLDSAHELLEGREFALLWGEIGDWVLGDLSLVPNQILKDPLFKNILRNRFQTEAERERISYIYAFKEIQWENPSKRRDEYMKEYRKISFQLKTPRYNQYGGWSSEVDQKPFCDECRTLFRSLGWDIEESDHGFYDMAVLNKERLYLHPGSIKGAVLDSSIPDIEKSLCEAKTFAYCQTVVGDICYDLTDTEYLLKLRERQSEIVKELLNECKTSRRDRYITYDIVRVLAERYHIPRLGEDMGDPIAYGIIQNILDTLVAKGEIIQTKKDQIPAYRTATEKDKEERASA